jgi:hypothetical protein
MRRPIPALAGCAVAYLAASAFGQTPAPPAGLVKNPYFQDASSDPKFPAHWTLAGDAAWSYGGRKDEFATHGVALHSGKDIDGDGKRAGSVSQDDGLQLTAGQENRIAELEKELREKLAKILTPEQMRKLAERRPPGPGGPGRPPE